jgi:hypothetical protein
MQHTHEMFVFLALYTSTAIAFGAPSYFIILPSLLLYMLLATLNHTHFSDLPSLLDSSRRFLLVWYYN